MELAHDGKTGLWLATETNPDVIVLDVMLPKLNGFQVCAELRKAENWTPILMLTAKEGEFDHAEGLDAGADDYLSKPVSYVILLAHLRALLRRGSRARPTRLSAGDLVIDPATHRCWRNEVLIELYASAVRAARVPDAPEGRGAVQDGDPRARVGPRVRRGRQHRRGLHPLPAPEDRRSVPAERDPDPPPGGVPARCRRRIGPRPPERLTWLWCVRARTTLLASVAVTLALLIASLALTSVLRQALLDDLDTAALARVDDMAGIIRAPGRSRGPSASVATRTASCR